MYQGDPALFHGPEQGILLGLAEPVDLVDEQDGVALGEEASALFGLFDHFPDLLDA